ncbi:hypothetical protein N7326_05695 [Corynebacterium sp. ES2794-CONJ1]|uniref:hypothetical protein n=1 Tax=Corynebacterium sp. ES2794-CONJ1 TaxID=2980553 RepID=UPI0021DA330D|nr:hypothetical protein [Corynebacterium sp. ES2794-CONJ1]MCU9519369.1 hypothetical protein [Corynebacterium sp. ES2794-CONJ1]
MRYWKILSSVLLASLVLGACTTDPARQISAIPTTQVADHLEQSRTRNLGHHVNPIFDREPVVLSDTGSGIAAVRHFFEAAETLVISDPDIAHQLRAASIAVVAHAPMLTMTDDDRDDIIAEIDRLGVKTILLVGDVPLASLSGDVAIIKDTLTPVALGDLTALQFQRKAITYQKSVIRSVAKLPGDEAVELVPAWDEEFADMSPQERFGRPDGGQKLRPFPLNSKRDADTAPIVIASADSSIAAVASTRAFGAKIRVLAFPDPRFSVESMRKVAGLSNHPLVALGEQFGSAAELADRIEAGEQLTQYQPGPGRRGLVFPQRSIAAVEMPATKRVDHSGIFTERLAQARADSAEMGKLYDHVISPAVFFDMDNTNLSELDGWLEQLKDADAYGIIKVRSFKELQRFKAEVIAPHVGVYFHTDSARDTEDHTADNREVEKASEWLSLVVRAQDLPQKIFITDFPLTTRYDELSYVHLIVGKEKYLKEAAELPPYYHPALELLPDSPLAVADIDQVQPRLKMLKRSQKSQEFPALR